MNPHTTSPAHSEPSPDVDGLLRDFFRSELPDPWPAAPEVREQPRALPLRRERRRPPPRQLALAAAVALFLVGYWTLAQCFPTPPAPEPGAPGGDFAPVRAGVMANQPEKLKNRMELERPEPQLHQFVVPTPEGQVQIREKRLPDNRIFMRLELLEGRGGQK